MTKAEQSRVTSNTATPDACVEGVDACNQRTAIQFIDDVLRRLPFLVHVVQTDNGAEFQSQLHWHVEQQDIRHVYIRPRTPHLNGKVERSHRIDDQEFYQLLGRAARHTSGHPDRTQRHVRRWYFLYRS